MGESIGRRFGLGRESSAQTAELEQAYRMRLAHLVPVEQPLVVISQIQRSGGTLLAQLFAGHPQCHVHPGEMHIGFPKKEFWPDFDLADRPERWFAMLLERRIGEYARDGFIKVPERLRSSYDPLEIAHPFVFVPTLQREIFEARLSATGVRSQRDILNAYMTSYFNAWLDYQELYGAEKRWVVGFIPRMSMHEDGVERFFRDYPDGRMISILREPRSWFVSFKRKKPEERSSPESGIARWKSSAQAMLANKRRYGDRIQLLRFDALLGDTEGTMRGLAAWLGLEFAEILTRPTFQSLDIRANSSQRVQTTGILAAPLRRSAELSEADLRYIETETRKLYEETLAEIDGGGA